MKKLLTILFLMPLLALAQPIRFQYYTTNLNPVFSSAASNAITGIVVSNVNVVIATNALVTNIVVGTVHGHFPPGADGDMLYYGGGNWQALSKGLPLQMLSMDTSDPQPVWTYNISPMSNYLSFNLSGEIPSGKMGTNAGVGRVLEDHGTYAGWVSPTNLTGVAATNVFETEFGTWLIATTNSFLYHVDVDTNAVRSGLQLNTYLNITNAFVTNLTVYGFTTNNNLTVVSNLIIGGNQYVDSTIFYPEQFGAVGSANTNDDSFAWQKAWYAAIDPTNVYAVIDGRGRSYNINTTIHSDSVAPRNRQVTIKGAGFITTNIAPNFCIWSNNCNYTIFENLWFGMQTNANVGTIALCSSGDFPNNNVYNEMVQFHNIIITNFAIGIKCQYQDNPSFEAVRILGCKSNSIYLKRCDQWTMQDSYVGFAKGPDGVWGGDFYSGVGMDSWLTNQIALEIHGGIGGSIKGGCAMNYVKQFIYVDGTSGDAGVNYSTHLSILGQNDFESCYGPALTPIIYLTNKCSINAQNLGYTIGTGNSQLIGIQLDNCNTADSFIVEPLTTQNTMDLVVNGNNGQNVYTLPRVIGGVNNYTVVWAETYGGAKHTNVLAGGNVPTTVANNSWLGQNQYSNYSTIFTTPLEDRTIILGGQQAANNSYSGISSSDGSGNVQSMLSFWDYSPGFYYRLYLGGGTVTPRHSPTDISFFTTDTYGSNGTNVLQLLGKKIIGRTDAPFYGNGSGLSNCVDLVQGTNVFLSTNANKRSFTIDVPTQPIAGSGASLSNAVTLIAGINVGVATNNQRTFTLSTPANLYWFDNNNHVATSSGVYFLAGTGGKTFTLPDCTVSPVGTMITAIVTNLAGGVIVSNANSQTILGQSVVHLGAANTTTNRITVINDGSNWN